MGASGPAALNETILEGESRKTLISFRSFASIRILVLDLSAMIIISTLLAQGEGHTASPMGTHGVQLQQGRFTHKG